MQASARQGRLQQPIPEAHLARVGVCLREAPLEGARPDGREEVEGAALPAARATDDLNERAGIKARKKTGTVRV